MSNMYYLLFVFLIIYILWYIYYTYSNNDIDVLFVVLLIISLTVLISTILDKMKGRSFESFVNNIPIPTELSVHENLDNIKDGLVSYWSTFNETSYNGSNKIINDNIDPNKKYICSISPTFDAKQGFFLGTNVINGPMCNELNIAFKDTYSIIITCRHGKLKNETNDIEIIKLFANSPNNNGLSLFIRKDSIAEYNDIQQGDLVLQFADREDVVLRKNASDTAINLDKNDIITYFIIKNMDHVKIVSMNDSEGTIRQLCRIEITPSDITLANKELVINRNGNWNANLLSFGIYNKALTDEQISSYFAHQMKNYNISNIEDYNLLIHNYNSIIQTVKDVVKCPFDANICANCIDVKDWTNPTDIVLSSDNCKSAINNFCIQNQTHSFCKCWRSNTQACTNFTSIFKKSNQSIIDNFEKNDISYLKEKWKLTNKDDCALKSDYDSLKKKFDETVANLDSSQKAYNKLADDVMIKKEKEEENKGFFSFFRSTNNK
jgi:hypothetical protein